MLFNNITIDFSSGTPKQTINKLIFLHIPKTGGESVEDALTNSFGKPIDKSHENVRQIQSGKLYDENIDEYKVFTVVRNPFDRLISTWRWWAYHSDSGFEKGERIWHRMTHELIMKSNNTGLSKKEKESWLASVNSSIGSSYKMSSLKNLSSTTFKEYLLMVQQYFKGNANVDEEHDLVYVDNKKAALAQSHIERLNWWLTIDDQNLIDCDFLMFENLSNEWLKYRKKIKASSSLGHKNDSNHIPFPRMRSELYDDETYKIISEIYKDEIEMFNYV